MMFVLDSIKKMLHPTHRKANPFLFAEASRPSNPLNGLSVSAFPNGVPSRCVVLVQECQLSDLCFKSSKTAVHLGISRQGEKDEGKLHFGKRKFDFCRMRYFEALSSHSQVVPGFSDSSQRYLHVCWIPFPFTPFPPYFGDTIRTHPVILQWLSPVVPQGLPAFLTL